jgi:hypothetical protein
MAPQAAPKIGQIVDHYFLWADEQAAGQIEGRKARPCIIIAVDEVDHTAVRVTLLPVTSQAPRSGRSAVAVPNNIKSRIGLDIARPAWVVVDEANVFVWPGFDLVPQPDGGFVRGLVTIGFYERLRDAVLHVRSRGTLQALDRDDE